MSGRIISNYQILDELEHGSLGALYRGRHLNLNTDVVLREIHLATFPVSTRVQLKARFRRELFIQAQLNHPSIARVYQSFVKGDNYYVVTEFVQGVSLRDLLTRQGLPTAPQALYICKQALAALDYAHTLKYLDESDVQRVGIIHRDIKPSNLVIDGQGKLKITDFGIVRMPDIQTLAPPSFQAGTAEYMPPEQIRGLDLDARSDIYSLGVTFYQVLTGHLPYTRSSNFVESEIMDNDPPLISEVRSDVNLELANIFARAIARNPGSRFQSAAEFLAVIRHYERSYNQVESPSKPFSSRPLKHPAEQSTTAEIASSQLSKSASQLPPAPTGQIRTQSEDRNQGERNNRTTKSIPDQHLNASATRVKKDPASLSSRRVTSPLPRSADRVNMPTGMEYLNNSQESLTVSGEREEPFFTELASSGTRVGWVVAAALTLIAVFAGFYLFVFKESRPERSLVIKAPVSVADISSASAALNPKPVEPTPPASLTSGDIDRLNQAREADRQGKFNTAISLYESFLRDAPESFETASVSAQLDRLRKFVAHLNAAKSAFNRQDYTTARDNYSEALKIRPYSRLVQNGIAECQSRISGGSGPTRPSSVISTRPRRTNPPVNN